MATSAGITNTVGANSSLTVHGSASVPTPKLWHFNTLNLYTVRTEISIGGVIVDRVDTEFGFRSIEFDREAGFFLNGQAEKLEGVC